MSFSTWEMGQPLAMRWSVCASQVSGSTSFILAVCSRVAIVAHVPAAAVAAREERVLARDCLRPDRPLDDVGIDLDTAVDEEAFENFAPGRGIADGLGQLRLPRDTRQLHFPEIEQLGHHGGRPLLTGGHAGCRSKAADITFNLPKRGQGRDG